jgi:hypothetical protein
LPASRYERLVFLWLLEIIHSRTICLLKIAKIAIFFSPGEIGVLSGGKRTSLDG